MLLGNRLLSLPRTKYGWLAVWLSLSLVVFMTIGVIATAGYTQVSKLTQILAPLGLLAMLAAVAAGPLAWIAIFRQGERSILVMLTLLPSAFALFFIVGEMLFPH